ncbi:glutamate--tRNA ligase [bacterium]|nr:glutamate--tRNA ligase [bacterium]
MAGTLRVRFAPSPTGYLHTGGARTALFNYLWAKGQGGVFILRVEDTDEERSTEESMRAILDGLQWLGIMWDEGPDPEKFGESIGPFPPYYQSMRRPLHQEYMKKLWDSGHVFYCPATAEEMTGPDGKKLTFSPYRDITREEQERRLAAGEVMPVRFRCPRDVEVSWEDAVRGKVTFSSNEVGDFVLFKGNGQPLYNFVVVCDDIDMHITNVLRGEDHISNTPKQILLHEALGHEPPEFGHVPLIVGMDRQRLSKRHGATAVDAYEEQGVLPEAMVNFLALIGWAPGDDREKMTLEEMKEAFDPHRCTKAAGAFNPDKLKFFNELYIRELSPDALLERLRRFIPPVWLEHRGEDYAKHVFTLFQEKIAYLNEMEANAWYFFRDPVEADNNEKSVAKFLTENESAKQVLSEIAAGMEALGDGEWTEEKLAPIVDGFVESSGLGRGKVMQPWRVALTGDAISPGFYDLVVTLGKDTVLRRVQPWIDRL